MIYLCVMCSVFLATSAASGHAHVNRSTLVFKLLPATSSNWSLVKPVRQWVPVTFLANLSLFMCQTSFISRVNKSGPGIGSQWILKHLQTLARSERPRKKGLGGFSDLKPDLFPPWKRLYEWNFGVRKCLWSPKFPTSNMVVNSYTPAGHACQDL